ncbi:NAD(P)/FAD-dependent oxidoreductase [Pedobacter sp. SYSU D00535]|uniref:NAD(P)/FAD-dependent oxidoreductase n=1 Tax=Pedobacter sp. SYSU D00535 TaxID=2810308 RepID=UPI001F61EBD6|nr:NAD(P)/FAD-dependent oxidoreductase [Pedobacter sp. SYSU D00535]
METLSRRKFIKQTAAGSAGFIFRMPDFTYSIYTEMKDSEHFDVIIIGGSYAGLAAGMALGRALKKVLIIDNGKPCNRQTPHSHNFITQDGETPGKIAALGRQQLEAYDSVKFFAGLATSGKKNIKGFEIGVASGETFAAKKLIFATGIKDLLPDIEGLAACWGITAIHCPYCHGYEVKNEKTGILGNGEPIFDFTRLIFNWTKDLTLFTNGTSALTREQTSQLEKHGIELIEKEIERLVHANGHLQKIVFRDGSETPLKAVYTPSPFEQHCSIPEALGCELSEEGYIKVDAYQETTVKGVFACGDNSTRMRTLANAVATGTTAGMLASKKMILEEF